MASISRKIYTEMWSMVDILASNIHTPKKPMPPPKRRVEARARKMSFNMVVIFISNYFFIRHLSMKR